MSDWLSALQQSSARSADTVPNGFKTREQIQKEIGREQSQTRVILRGLVAAGHAEKRTFRVPTTGGIRLVPHYRLQKPKPLRNR